MEGEEIVNKPKTKATYVARSTIDVQRKKLEKLMENPDKPVLIPDLYKEKDYLNTIPTFVRNVMGSSAGAGSGEFHVYRHLRRKEYARQKHIQQKSVQERLDEEHRERILQNQFEANEKTAKKRAKRLRKKQNRKEKLKKLKLESKDGVNKKSQPENSSSEENVNDDEDNSDSDKEIDTENLGKVKNDESNVVLQSEEASAIHIANDNQDNNKKEDTEIIVEHTEDKEHGNFLNDEAIIETTQSNVSLAKDIPDSNPIID